VNAFHVIEIIMSAKKHFSWVSPTSYMISIKHRLYTVIGLNNADGALSSSIHLCHNLHCITLHVYAYIFGQTVTLFGKYKMIMHDC